MNNIMYLRDACFEFNQSYMPFDLKQKVSTWLHVRPSEPLSTSDPIRLLHPIEVDDRFFRLMFSGNIIFYSTAMIGNVRFTTRHHALGKATDDSSIVFKVGTHEKFGRVDKIFSVDNGAPIFYIAVIPVTSPFKCVVEGIDIFYSQIQAGSFDEGTDNLLISASDVVEKCVYYEGTNRRSTFVRFPNLLESS